MSIVIAIIVLAALFVLVHRVAGSRRSADDRRIADAVADARSWTDRLGGQVSMVDPGGDRPARQALADAAERHASAERELATARTVAQVSIARRSAIEGLHYARAARIALGLDPGPDLPAEPVAAVAASTLSTGPDGRPWAPSPQRSDDSPYYFAGGRVGGRYAPAGWYGRPWWKTALAAGAAGMGGLLVVDTLLDGFHHRGGGGFGSFGGPGGSGGGPGPDGGFF